MNSDILFFFGEHMDALPLYERLEDQILTQIPEVKIKVAKTQITFANKRGFAFVSFSNSIVVSPFFHKFPFLLLPPSQDHPCGLQKESRFFSTYLYRVH